MFGLLRLPLNLLAGPYRVMSHRFRSFGGFWAGVLTWIGVVIGYLFFVLRYSGGPHDQGPFVLPMWGLLLLGAWLHMFAKWCSPKPPLDDCESHCWFGRGEPIYATVLCAGSWYFCGKGAGLYFAAGYGCNMAQVGLARCRRRLAAWTPDDSRRLFAPLRRAVEVGQVLAPKVGHAASVTASVAVPAGAIVLKGVDRVLRGAPVQVVDSDGQSRVIAHQRPQPTFAGRIVNHLAMSMFIHFFTSVFGFSIFGLILAIPLWMMGWTVSIPTRVKEHVEIVASKVGDAFHDKKEDMVENWREGREERAERWQERRERMAEYVDDRKDAAVERFRRGKEDLGEDLKRQKDKLAEQARREARSAVYRSLSPW